MGQRMTAEAKEAVHEVEKDVKGSKFYDKSKPEEVSTPGKQNPEQEGARNACKCNPCKCDPCKCSEKAEVVLTCGCEGCNCNPCGCPAMKDRLEELEQQKEVTPCTP